MVHTHGWVRRKVKNSDKWVRRWIEVNKHVLYSYQSCPADMPSARVMNMLDLRKTRTIDVVDGEEGLFVIVPQSSDDARPGYLMKANSKESALAWVAGLNAAREMTRLTPSEQEGVEWFVEISNSIAEGACDLPLDQLISVGADHLQRAETYVFNQQPPDPQKVKSLRILREQAVQWKHAAAEAAALGLDGSVTYNFWERQIELPAAFIKCRKFFEIVEKLPADQFRRRRQTYMDSAPNRIREVYECVESWPPARRASIARRLLKLRLKVQRWREAHAEDILHEVQARTTHAKARDHATVLWDRVKDQTREAAEQVSLAKQTRREIRAMQLRKRTCCVCAKIVPLSSRALAYYGGCRHASVARKDRPRYCSEACERANWTDGHNRVCPNAHLKDG